MLPAHIPSMVHRHIDTSTHRPSRATRCQHANAGLVQHDPVYIELGISTSLWNRHKVPIYENFPGMNFFSKVRSVNLVYYRLPTVVYKVLQLCMCS
jgi:hypothetical protein